MREFEQTCRIVEGIGFFFCQLPNPLLEIGKLIPEFIAQSLVLILIDYLVQTVHINSLQATFQPISLLGHGAQLGSAKLFILSSRRVQHRHDPSQDIIVNVNSPQDADKLILNQLLPGIPAGTFAPIPGAMIVDIFPFLDFSNKGAPAVTTGQHSMEQEIMRLSSGRTVGTLIKHSLHLVEQLLSNDRFMSAWVKKPLPIEVTIVDGVGKQVIKRTLGHPIAAIAVYQSEISCLKADVLQ